MLDEVDPRGEGSFAFAGFLHLVAPILAGPEDTTCVLEEEFEIYADASGYILSTDVRRMIEDMGEPVSDEEVLELIASAQPDHLGRIDYEGFVRMLMVK